MAGSSWGDVQVYNEMISDLGSFNTSVNEACCVMLNAAQTCLDNMESDKASLSASKNLRNSVVKYQEATATATALARELSEERDALIEYLRSLEEMDSDS